MMSGPYTLVLQAPMPLSMDRLSELAAQSGASHIDTPTPHLARLQDTDLSTRPAVCAQCDAWGWDAAFVPGVMRFSDIRLVVSDMDSTLITIECIDEIADMLGIKSQVAAITERSMRGELDFRASLTERVALLAGLDEHALETVYQQRLHLSDGALDLLSACKQHNVKFMLVSGGFTFFTDRLKARLDLDYTFANQLEIRDGKLTGKTLGPIVDATAKHELLIRMRDELGLARNRFWPSATAPTI